MGSTQINLPSCLSCNGLSWTLRVCSDVYHYHKNMWVQVYFEEKVFVYFQGECLDWQEYRNLLKWIFLKFLFWIEISWFLLCAHGFVSFFDFITPQTKQPLYLKIWFVLWRTKATLSKLLYKINVRLIRSGWFYLRIIHFLWQKIVICMKYSIAYRFWYIMSAFIRSFIIFCLDLHAE